MHGIIHLELRNFVISGYGASAWQTLLERAGLIHEIYTPLNTHPDEQIVNLVTAAAELTGVPHAVWPSTSTNSSRSRPSPACTKATPCASRASAPAHGD